MFGSGILTKTFLHIFYYNIAFPINSCFLHVLKTIEIYLFILENSSVTSLKFLPRTLTLAVGYEFGCYQLWSMETLETL